MCEYTSIYSRTYWCPACPAWVFFANISSYCEHLCLFLRLFSGLLEGQTKDAGSSAPESSSLYLWQSWVWQISNPRFCILWWSDSGAYFEPSSRSPQFCGDHNVSIGHLFIVSLILTYFSHLPHSYYTLLMFAEIFFQINNSI